MLCLESNRNALMTVAEPIALYQTAKWKTPPRNGEGISWRLLLERLPPGLEMYRMPAGTLVEARIGTRRLTPAMDDAGVG